MPVYRPSELHSFLEEGNLKAKKSLSQNFLIDGNILKKILAAAQVEKGDYIVEIGPGPGALTEALLEAGAHVLAIEMDKVFAKRLSRLQTSDSRLKIIEADILELDPKQYLNKKTKVISNLPYHIVSPILEILLPLHHQISTLTLMVQKEYAARMSAKKNSSDFSPLTLFVQFFSNVKYCFAVKPHSFFPVPKVDSAIVQLQLKEPDPEIKRAEFFKFIKTAFQKRRKTLSSSLREYAAHDRIQQILKEIGCNPQARPENLSFEEWSLFFKRLFL